MAKERLSKLQKWILVQALADGLIRDNEDSPFYEELHEEHKFYSGHWKSVIKYHSGETGEFDNPFFISRERIFKYFFKVKSPVSKSASVTLSTSIKNLREKGFVEPWNRIYCEIHHFKEVFLTSEGMDKAKELMKECIVIRG